MKGILVRAVWLLGLGASVASVVSLYRAFWSNAESDGKWGMAILGGYTALLFLFVLWQEYRFSRKARYAEAGGFFRETLMECLGPLEDLDAMQLKQKIQRVCDALSLSLSVVTGTRCSACVKIFRDSPQQESSRIEVQTLCRNRASERREGRDGEVKHWLDKNTDYLQVFEQHKKPLGSAFFENDLPGLPDYSNTSFDLYGYPDRARVPVLREFLRRQSWPLPYKSTIVAAILPDSSEGDQINLLGYLCVDSSSRNAFSKRYDREWVQEVARALYPAVRTWGDRNS